MRDVAPAHASPLGQVEPAQPHVVLVGHRGQLGRRDRLGSDQVRALVHRHHQSPPEGAEAQAREGDREAAAVGRDPARRHVVDGTRAPDLVGGARQAGLLRDALDGRGVVHRRGVAQVERGVPEDVPLVAVHHLLRDLHAQLAQGHELLVADPAEPLDDPELEGRSLGHRGPPATAPRDRQPLDHGGAVPGDEAHAQPLRPRALPLELDASRRERRDPSAPGLVAFERARESLRGRGRGRDREDRRREHDHHGHGGREHTALEHRAAGPQRRPHSPRTSLDMCMLTSTWGTSTTSEILRSPASEQRM